METETSRDRVKRALEPSAMSTFRESVRRQRRETGERGGGLGRGRKRDKAREREKVREIKDRKEAVKEKCSRRKPDRKRDR